MTSEQILRQIERDEADLRTATLDTTTIIPTVTCPGPLVGHMPSYKGRQIVEADYEGVWNL